MPERWVPVALAAAIAVADVRTRSVSDANGDTSRHLTVVYIHVDACVNLELPAPDKYTPVFVLTPAVVVNGEQNNMLISLQNTGEKNYTLVSASASYHDHNKDWKLLRNATATKLNIPLIAGSNVTAPYRLNSE